jgi:ferric-dicitrate binding protein FerR (iron transport regulator)
MKRTENRYDGYTAEELLMDDFFLESTRRPTPGSEAFWARVAAANPASRREIERASRFLALVKQPADRLPDEEVDALWARVTARRRRFARRPWSIAAGVAMLLAVGAALYLSREEQEPLPVAREASYSPLEVDDVVLVLADRQRQHISGEEVEVNYTAGGKVKINAEIIPVDLPATDEAGEPPYNHLIVPPGRRSSVLFPDGTRVWVNACSHVWYPVTWAEDKRQLFVEGEVFIDVAGDDARPFHVSTRLLEVKVTGTRFNVTAHDSTAHAVVLERGEVNVKATGHEEITLRPAQRFTYTAGKVAVDEVDTREYTTWKEGVLYFSGTPLGTILYRLDRYYGREITCDDEVADMTCSGKLELKPNMEEVLDGLVQTVPVRVERLDEKVHVTINTL